MLLEAVETLWTLNAAGARKVPEEAPTGFVGKRWQDQVFTAQGVEPGFPPQQAFKHGAWQPDPLVLDDQAVVVTVRDRGLVVVSGCGHTGNVNITRYAQKLTGVQQLYAVIGGFHLGGLVYEKIIAPTVAALTQIAPQVIVPAHCTGWRAHHALAAALPEAFVPNSVGSSFVLGAE